MGQIDVGQQTTPQNPEVGKNAIYPKADGNWYIRTNAGVEEQLSTATGLVQDKVFFVAKTGSDINTGTSLDAPFLTFGAAVAAATAETPSASNRWGILCLDGGIYTENFTLPSYVQVHAPMAGIVGNIIMSDFSLLDAYQLSGATGTLISKITGFAAAEITLENMLVQGTAAGILCTSGAMSCGINAAVNSGTGAVLGGASTGRIDYTGNTMDLLATGSGIDFSGSGETSLLLNVLNGVAATGIILTSNATLSASIGRIDCNVAYNVGASAHLDLVIADLTGTETATGTVHVLKAAHPADTANPHAVTKTQVGLANVDNLQQIPATEKAAINGVASLDGTGKVPAAQLPSYVDDVEEYANLAAFPVTGETGKIYVALDTNLIYRWTGSIYIEIATTSLSIDDLTDVTITSPAFKEFLHYDGANWINRTFTEAEMAWDKVTLTAGTGLTGGGNLTTNRTFNVGAGTGITVNADDVEVIYGTTVGTACVGNDARLHAESHTVASHNDTSATGTELNTLTDGSNANGLHLHNTDSIEFPTCDGETIDTLGEVLTLALSAGLYTGGIISDAGGGDINVSLGSMLLRVSDSHTADIKSCEFDAVVAISIPLDTVRYVHVFYNSGTPVIQVTSGDEANYHDKIRLGTVVNEGGTLHVLNNAQIARDPVSHIDERFYETRPLERAERLGGLIIGETGTRNVTLSAGELYDGLVEFVIPSFDSSGVDNFDRYYRDGGGGWTKESAQTQWPNGFYDDGTGVLAALGNNQWTNIWFYLEADGDIVMLYGRNEYASLAAAELDTPPASVPDRILTHGRLIGRFIFQEAAAVATDVESVFNVVFGSTGVASHNDLGSLQGGAAGEYYHLTSTDDTNFNTLTDASNADSLHTHAHSAITGKTANDHHNELHTVASHSDTTATGSELNELTDGSNTILHEHVFGSEYEYDAQETIQTTTSLTFEEAHSFTTASLTAGRKYLIQFGCEWTSTGEDRDTTIRIQFDDTTDLAEFFGRVSEEDYYQPLGNFFEYTATSTGTHTIDFDFHGADTGRTISMRKIRTTIWRVG